MKKIFPLHVLITISFLAACGSATPEPTATPLPPQPTNTPLPSATPAPTDTSTPLPTATATAEPSWTVIDKSLAAVDSWTNADVKLDFDVSIVDNTLIVIAPQDLYANPINTATHLELSTGDFGILFEMESGSADFAGLSLYGILAQDGEWWEGITRLDIGIKGGKVAVGYWNGTAPTPAVWSEFTVSGAFANRKIELGVQKLGDQFIILAKGNEIGQVNDPGLFNSNVVYFGVNVAPKNQLTLYSITVQENEGSPITIR
jgi:hypothetical protein